MSTVIASVALVAIVGGAITYIVKEKRKGTKCIGCLVSSSCTFNPKYLYVLTAQAGFTVESSSKVHIFLPQLPATLALPATPATPAMPLTLVLLFILVIAAASTFGCARGYRKGFIK